MRYVILKNGTATERIRYSRENSPGQFAYCSTVRSVPHPILESTKIGSTDLIDQASFQGIDTTVSSLHEMMR